MKSIHCPKKTIVTQSYFWLRATRADPHGSVHSLSKPAASAEASGRGFLYRNFWLLWLLVAVGQQGPLLRRVALSHDADDDGDVVQLPARELEPLLACPEAERRHKL